LSQKENKLNRILHRQSQEKTSCELASVGCEYLREWFILLSVIAKFRRPLCSSRSFSSAFYFFRVYCTQNTPKQLKIKEISPHKESFLVGIEKPIFD